MNINEEIKKLMLAKNKMGVTCLRAVKTAITNAEKQKGKGDTDLISQLKKQVKQRQDSFEQFTKAGRTDLADKEKLEIEFLQTYLPTELSQEELSTLVKETVGDRKIERKELGKLIAAIFEKAKGSADKKAIAKELQKFV